MLISLASITYIISYRVPSHKKQSHSSVHSSICRWESHHFWTILDLPVLVHRTCSWLHCTSLGWPLRGIQTNIQIWMDWNVWRPSWLFIWNIWYVFFFSIHVSVCKNLRRLLDTIWRRYMWINWGKPAPKRNLGRMLAVTKSW